MTWIDHLYDASLSIPLSLVICGIVTVLTWRSKGRQVILALTLFLYARYLVWRGLYTLNTDDWLSGLISGTVLLAEAYGLFQFMFFTVQAWSPIQRKPQPITTYRTVDVFVTVVNEPLDILRRTLVGCINQDYPSSLYRVYVLDDGHRDDVKALTQSMGCGYLRRDKRLHAKAGNLNHALERTAGELIAVFDTDHVPTSAFLRDTVGFFENDRVAIVQTPHHFYNPDIFQKNLRLQSELENEQELFFRVLQPGRDAHNSAFFAGSSGLFRRGPLIEIGGFQTDTITEDIHTSLLIHAKGYESRYLNRVLSAGLMPETFKGYLKQRTRWAIGSLQMCIKCNPLTLKGLTWSQRVNYFGSVYYFLHGVPRLVCLAAPLFALWLSIAPIHATIPTILHFFGSYFIASLMMMRAVSRGTRNAFWGDVYETAMCFSLSKATLTTVLRPHKPQPFVVTPKGEKLKKRGISHFSIVVPHLVLFGLLVSGLTMGLQTWLHHQALPGLEVALFWGTVNLILLSLAIFCANEMPQWRNAFRLPRRVACVLTSGQARIQGYTKDVSEHGLCIEVQEPFLPASQWVTLHLEGADGLRVTLQGMMTRQERVGKTFEVGLSLAEIGEAESSALIQEMFCRPDTWADVRNDGAGIWESLRTMFTAFLSAKPSRRPARRLFPRTARQLQCEIQFDGRSYSGRTKDVSFQGLAANMDDDCTGISGQGLVSFDGITLKVTFIGLARNGREVTAQFRVDSVDKGESSWHALNSSGW